MSQTTEFASFEPPSPAELSAMLPRYEFCDFIAQGGMGAVYLARQPSLERFVAVKVLPPLSQGEVDAAAHLTREARAMARLTHNNIVAVHDFGVTDSGWFYLVMEHVEGETLHHIIQSRKLTLQSVRSFTLQLCDALIFAHEHGIVHRDIKPSNILVSREGRVKLADFGLARPLAAYEQEVALGTPGYVAPEIVNGERVDHRADIYALGVVVFEMLTGRVPWSQDGKVAAVMPEGGLWNEVVHKAIRPHPEQRFCDMREFRAAVLRATTPRRVPAVSPPKTERRGRLNYRYRRNGARTRTRWFSLRSIALRFTTPKNSQLPQSANEKDKGSSASSNFPRLFSSMVLFTLLGAAGWWYWPQLDHFWSSTKSTTAAMIPPGTTSASPSDVNHSLSSPSNRIVQAVSNLIQFSSPSPASSSGAVLSELLENEQLDIELVPAGHVSRMQEGHDDWISSVALFPDGRRVASSSADGTIAIWDVVRGRCLVRFGPFENPIQRVAVSGDGKWIAAGGGREKLRVWNASTGELKAQHAVDERDLTGLAFSFDGQWLLSSCTRSGASLRAWQWQSEKTNVVLKEWAQIVNALALIPGGETGRQQFFTVGGGRDEQGLRMELWLGDLFTAAPILKLKPRPLVPSRVAVSHGGQLVAFTQGTSLHIVEVQHDRDIAVCVGHEGMVESLRFLLGGKFLLSAAQDRTIRIWETATGEEVCRFDAKTFCTTHVTVSPDEKWMVSGGGMRWGSPIQRDGEYSLHIWRLPDLTSIETEHRRLARAREEFTRLEEIDPELATLRSRLLKDWSNVESKAQAALEEAIRSSHILTTKYFAALQRELPSQRGEDRDAFLKEIDRVKNRLPMPAKPQPQWPQVLRSLFTIYQQELQKIRIEMKPILQHEANLQQSVVNQLIQRRTAEGGMSLLRAKVLLEEVQQRNTLANNPSHSTVQP